MTIVGASGGRLHSGREILAIAFIGVALCVIVYNEVSMIVPLHSHNVRTFIAFNHEANFPAGDTPIGFIDLGKAWRPRLLSNIAGAWATRSAFTADTVNKGFQQITRMELQKFRRLVGLYVAFWLGLTFLLYLITLGGNALIPILGTFAAVAFGYMPGIGDRVYPWDMPPLFFCTLFVCMLLRDKLVLFLCVLPVAVLFKETAAVLVAAYLFVSGSRRRRMALFGTAAALCVVPKVTVDVLTHSTGRFTFDASFLATNMRFLFLGSFPYPEWYPGMTGYHHPLLLNAGLLVAFMVYPFRGAHVWMLRAIVLCFIAGTLLYGIMFEYRIWFDIVPLLLYPLYEPLLVRPTSASAASGGELVRRHPQPSRRGGRSRR